MEEAATHPPLPLGLREQGAAWEGRGVLSRELTRETPGPRPREAELREADGRTQTRRGKRGPDPRVAPGSPRRDDGGQTDTFPQLPAERGRAPRRSPACPTCGAACPGGAGWSRLVPVAAPAALAVPAPGGLWLRFAVCRDSPCRALRGQGRGSWAGQPGLPAPEAAPPAREATPPRGRA